MSKLTDCDGENNETDISLEFARASGYVGADQYTNLTARNREVGKMLGAMIKNPRPFLLKPDL